MDFKTGMENILNQPIQYTAPTTHSIPATQVPVSVPRIDSAPVIQSIPSKLNSSAQSNKSLLFIGIIVCVLGLLFAIYMYNKIKKEQIKQS